MFCIIGEVENVFTQPGWKGKEGKETPDQIKVQIKGEMKLKNGETRIELITLSIPSSRVQELKDCKGTTVTLPCGIFASNGKIVPFLTD